MNMKEATKRMKQDSSKMAALSESREIKHWKLYGQHFLKRKKKSFWQMRKI